MRSVPTSANRPAHGLTALAQQSGASETLIGHIFYTKSECRPLVLFLVSVGLICMLLVFFQFSTNVSHGAASSQATTGFLTKLNTNASGASSLAYSTFLGTTGATFPRTVSSAVAGTPTGTVQFNDGAANLGSPQTLNVSAQAISTTGLTAGSHVITAVYSGDAVDATSTGTLSGGQFVNDTPVISFSQSTYNTSETAGSVTITVNRTGLTGPAVMVDYATDDTGALTSCAQTNGLASSRCDFTTASGTLKFAASETQKTFVVLVNRDSYVEGPETFTVNLSNPTGGAILSMPSTATVTIADDSSGQPPNAIDDAQFFVQQHYHDFLNREPDAAGLNFWVNQITSCGADQQCIAVKRINVSAAFYLSIEFQDTGYLVERIYKASYGDASGTSTFGGTHQLPVPIIRLNEFLPDTQEIGQGVIVGQGNWQQQLEDNKNAFTAEFVQRARFTTAFPSSMTAAQFVDTLNANAGNPLSQTKRDQLVTDLATNAKTRAQVLLAAAKDPDLNSAEFNRAFVLMQYFGYLRRNPNDPQDTDYTGYDFWLTKLNQFGGNYINAEMVKAFITSSEYRSRFGPLAVTPTPTPTPTPSGGAAPSAVVIDKPWVFFPSRSQLAQLTARVLDAQGRQVPGAVTWTSSAPDKVSVDASGRLMANAVGSAQIFAESAGIRSAPSLVTVAEPKAGALLVTDAQIISVGSPLNLAPGEPPGVGTQYEVRLQGVAAPAPGTVMLAAETAPVAGKVVATRQDTGGLVVTLALAPLFELFSDYDFNYNIDLSAFPVEVVPDQSGATTLNTVWNKQRHASPFAGVAAQPLDAIEPFKAFKCEGEIKPELLDKVVQLSADNQLELVLDDHPGYSKHALIGSFTLVGDVGFKMKAGFKASVSCEAQVQVRIPIFGAFSVLVCPAVRLGVGGEIEGEIQLVTTELSFQGKLGFSTNSGWECGGATPDCRALDNISPINEFKPKATAPSENDMKVEGSVQLYAFAALDLSIGGGLVGNAEILKAKIGPKQSFDLAFEEDQAAKTDYASSYDLKLEGVIEPGSALKEAIKKVINDDAVGVSFKAKFSSPISESPKGSLSLDKARVRPQEKVQFTVSLDPKTLEYFPPLIGYNVTGVELWRKREDVTEFTRWKAMEQNASNQYVYTWTPTVADAGKYQFAAFVNTQFPVPLLEVMPNSIQNLEVGCFSSAGTRPGTQASICADTWVGTYGRKIESSDVGLIEQVTSNITWTVDPSQSNNQVTVYRPGGSFGLKIGAQIPGCTAEISPSVFTIDPASGFLGISNGSDIAPGTYNFTTRQGVSYTETVNCPGQNPQTLPVQGFIDYASGGGPFMTGQVSLVGSSSTQVGSVTVTNSWAFSRP